MAKNRDWDTEIGAYVKDIGEWSTENFGSQVISNPLLGMAEELGELATVINKEATEEEFFIDEFNDAIGDHVIYLCDFIYRAGLPGCGLLEAKITTGNDLKFFLNVCSTSGEIAHLWLKKDQRIREGAYDEDVWRGLMEEKCAVHLGNLWALCHVRCCSLRSILAKTWKHVKQRNWKENKETGNGSNSKSD